MRSIRMPGFVLVCLTLLSTVPAALLAQPAATGQPEEKNLITVYVRRSEVIRAPWPVKRVAVTDPKIADVKVLTPDQVLVQGKTVGSTDLILWSEKEQAWRARIDVDVDLGRLKTELGRLFPGAALEVSQSQDVLVVSGALRRAEHAQQLHKFLEAYGVKFVDVTHVAGVQQVLLKVRVAEVSRTAIRALGINAVARDNRWFPWFGGSVVGSDGGGALQPVSIGPVAGADATRSFPFLFNSDVEISPSVTLFAGFPDIDLEVFLLALAENQYLRILAEPNLVALSGEKASFLAGGEFPVPVVQGGTTGGTSISVQYRDFGVSLEFRPVVLGDGTIRLYVAPEVSDLSDVGAVVIEGFRIPSVITRRARTTLELKNNQTFAMAGLINRVTNARTSRVPGLGDLPVLGSLFRSVRYQQAETELVVLVTASLVEPLSEATRPPSPGMLHVTPSDWELYVLGRIEGRAPAPVAPPDAEWLKKLGLDRIKGPGAWSRYEQKMAQSQAQISPAEAEDESRAAEVTDDKEDE